MKLTQDQWKRFAALNPPLEGESRTDWAARLERLAAEKRVPQEQPRLPYSDDTRMPGQEG